MAITAFSGSFTQQEPLPDSSHARVAEVLKSGRLHRYGMAAGERSEAAMLEAAYANWQGARFCLAVTSGGQALQIALRAVGVKSGDAVLTNAFTLAPVPGAIAAVGGRPVLVETTQDLTIDLEDLDRKAMSSGAKVLMLSHMRGHLADMSKVVAICKTRGLTLVEDCAHTMGATFEGVRSGNHGQVACFSSQTYKHINSGEGGFLTTDDPQIAARATMMSGSYMNFTLHGAGPDAAAYDTTRYEMPNMSARMDTIRAALLVPQIEGIDHNVARWNRRHAILVEALRGNSSIVLPHILDAAVRVGSSFQFRMPSVDADSCRRIVASASELGVELKWFGADEPRGFTSNHKSWRYMEAQSLPVTDQILSTLFDMRVPLTFSQDDCHHIGEILGHVVKEELALRAA